MKGFIAKKSKKRFDLRNFMYETRYMFLLLWLCSLLNLFVWAYNNILSIAVLIISLSGLIIYITNFAYLYNKDKKTKRHKRRL